jgi:hypothetical protein
VLQRELDEPFARMQVYAVSVGHSHQLLLLAAHVDEQGPPPPQVVPGRRGAGVHAPKEQQELPYFIYRSVYSK